MIQYTAEQIQTILDLHARWLRGEAEGRRADLSRADLSDADLSGADLRGADLRVAVLRDADLRGADLSRAVLRGADISHNQFVISATLGRYSVYAYIDRSGFRITAGCRRSLTLEQAVEHWSPANRHWWTEQTDEYGERMTRIVRFLESEARLLGWDVDGEIHE